MVGPPDSKNLPPAPAAEAHPDLTLNNPTSGADADAVADLRLEPDVDSLSTFVPEHAPPERPDIVPHAPAQAQQTRVDFIQPDTYIVWPVHDEDRSWWSRLRSLKASWEAKHHPRSAHDEPMATHADAPGPAARTDELTMDAIRNLERHLASLAALRDACASIDRRVAQVEAASRHKEPATIDEALHDVCARMSDRLAQVEAAVRRTEDVLHRREDIVAEWLEQLSTRLSARLAENEETIQRIERERVDETLRLTHQALADSMLPERTLNIERQLAQASMTVERTERAVSDRTLHELCANIEARLERTEDTLHRREGIVTEWLQELSADMTARFAEAEEAIQRIERIVATRTLEQSFSQQPSERTDRPIWQPWMARLAVPALVLVAALAIAAVIKTSRGVTSDTVVPTTTGDQVVTPVDQPTNEIRAVSATTVVTDAPPPTRASRVSAPQARSLDRRAAPSTSRPPRFVGTLSITSVPSGAAVSLNGKPAGVTPLRLPRQRAGSLAVQVAHDGFERWSAAVVVPADQLTQVTAKLRASR